MISSNKIGVQLLVEQCIKHGLKRIVFSPGSRNAPLVIAFDEHPDTECIVIHDERSAAFFAMGMAQKLNEPVAIVCTSGSAVLNYYPAVAEAYYQCIPLVIITADRPNEWIDQGDGQTIVQDNVFKNHIRYSNTFSESFENENKKWFLEREISKGFNIGNGNWKGPIHFNIGLTEPLYNSAEIERFETKTIHFFQSKLSLNADQLAEIKQIWNKAEKIMVVCGQTQKNYELLKQLTLISEDNRVAVLVENTSNLVHSKFIHCIDRTLNTIHENEVEEFNPDLIISLGGAVVSKKIKAFIRKAKVNNHIKIGYDFPFMDTYQSLTYSIEANPEDFFELINSFEKPLSKSLYGSKWKQKDYLKQEKMASFFQRVPYSDISVFEMILDFIPENANLHMANSSVVRYCQLFDPISSITYWSNRGTSGIDGSTSTAAGISFASKSELNVLITGDISFFYDSNALWNNHLSSNLRIILINNEGGGIFKIIPGPSDSNQLEKYFVAKHQYKAEFICKAFDVEYYKAESLSEIENQMEDFYKYSDRPKLIEIFTPSDINHKMLEEFFNEH